MWEEEVFPGVTLDDLADLVDFPVIPPVAGGAPGFLDEFKDAYGWTKSDVLAPVGGWLGVGVGEIVRACLTAITGFFSLAGWWIYRFCDAVFRYGSLTLWRQKFPHYALIKGLSPWYYLHKVAHMLFYAIVERVRGFVHWVRDRVVEARNWLEGRVVACAWWVRDRLLDARNWLKDRVWDAIEWVRQRVNDARNWLKDRVWDAIEWVRDRVVDARNWIKDKVWDAAGWIRDRVVDARNWIKDKVWDAADWIWGRVEEAWAYFEEGVESIVTAVAEAIGGGIRKAFEWVMNSVFEPFVDIVEGKLAIPGKLIRAEYGSLEEILEDILDPPRKMLQGWTGMILFPLMVAGLMVNLVTGLSGPYLEPILQEQARKVGARIPTYQMLRDGYLRGKLDEWVHDDWLGRSGFEQANIALQKALYEEIPGPTDLVRMGVREVFTPEIAERFGQFQDFPEMFGEWMARQGYTMEWARNYWGAHWDLPSSMQGFEMFHRDVISEGDLRLLLRALDVMPYWRDKLQQIAYNPLTRVDVRRMYSAGVIDEAKVERTYRDLGYTPENARLLRQWVVKEFPRKDDAGNLKVREDIVSVTRQAYARRLISRDTTVDRLRDADYTAEEAELQVDVWDFDFYLDPSLRSDVNPKQLGISVIERAYERRMVGFNAAVRELGELGYTPEDAKLRLQLVDLRLEEHLADLEIEVALDEYYAGLIGDAQLAARLKDLHIPEARVEYLVREQVLRRQVKDKQLTLSQLKRAVAADIIGVGEFRFRLDAMGYNSRDVKILVELEAGAV